MENMTVSNTTMALAAAVDSLPAAVHVDGAARTISLFIVSIFLVGLALFVILMFCGLPLLGFVSSGITFGSIAAAWMSSIGPVAAGSLFALLQAIAMGGVPGVVVLLGIVAVVAVAVGAFEAVVWVAHAAWSSVDMLGWWHSILAWLLQVWHSATDWVAHAAWSSVDMLGWWHSILAWLLQVWHSATDWVVHLWGSIPVHHKWKILYT